MLSFSRRIVHCASRRSRTVTNSSELESKPITIRMAPSLSVAPIPGRFLFVKLSTFDCLAYHKHDFYIPLHVKWLTGWLVAHWLILLTGWTIQAHNNNGLYMESSRNCYCGGLARNLPLQPIPEQLRFRILPVRSFPSPLKMDPSPELNPREVRLNNTFLQYISLIVYFRHVTSYENKIRVWLIWKKEYETIEPFYGYNCFL